jgi:hypothetical protein
MSGTDVNIDLAMPIYLMIFKNLSLQFHEYLLALPEEQTKRLNEGCRRRGLRRIRITSASLSKIISQFSNVINISFSIANKISLNSRNVAAKFGKKTFLCYSIFTFLLKLVRSIY